MFCRQVYLAQIPSSGPSPRGFNPARIMYTLERNRVAKRRPYSTYPQPNKRRVRPHEPVHFPSQMRTECAPLPLLEMATPAYVSSVLYGCPVCCVRGES
eukprot:6230330-Pyramimonas_sp.AAC.1